ncbi:MAG: glutathione S-transferase N-terminal domain-containing protein [Pseudomonadota bacterium]
MAILRTSPASPFGRKCAIAALVLGLEDHVTTQSADTSDPLDSLRQQNPLGKIPTLVLEDGETFYDSAVIIAYLDHLAGGNKLFPVDPMERIRTLRMQALADGIMEAALLQVYEVRMRPEAQRTASWTDRQAERVQTGLASIEADPPPATGAPTAGTIAIACALGYLDLRFEGAWRRNRPELVAWLNAFRTANPAFDATSPT